LRKCVASSGSILRLKAVWWINPLYRSDDQFLRIN
jgi:hypothetical protein